MILSRRSILTGCSAAVAAVVPACNEAAPPKNPMGMDFRDTYGPRPQVVKDAKGNLPVVSGRLNPSLAYMIEYQCTVRVLEIDSGKQIAQADAKPGNIVAMELAKGVSVDGKVIAAGPLDPLSEYGIFLDRK
jgi:hypothetical protein